MALSLKTQESIRLKSHLDYLVGGQIVMSSNRILGQVMYTCTSNLVYCHRPNGLDVRFNFLNVMVAHKESECKVLSYKENGYWAIEIALGMGL